MPKLCLLILLAIFGALGCPAVTHAQPVTLEGYVREGLRSNLALQQRHFGYEKSLAALRAARGRFLPSLTLSGRHSHLAGSVLDLGELINPVYATLNQLLQAEAFPRGLDLRLPLQRETKVTLSQPLFHPAIYYNYRVHTHRREAEAAQVQSFRRQLVADIKIAYFNYAKAVRVEELYQKTVPLLEENLRVNESLAANQKVTVEAVYRARAELSEVAQKQAAAGQQRAAAGQYFNFLLNRPLDTLIALLPDSLLTVEAAPLPAAVAPPRREEWQQLRAGLSAAQAAVRANTSRFLPVVGLGLDYGFQGNRYDFSADRDFLVISVVAEWNLFNGLQDAARRQHAQAEAHRLESRLMELQQQIALEVGTAHQDLQVAQRAIATANDRLASAEQSFSLVAKKYALGSAAQIEYLDARTTYTNAGINRILTTYDYFVKYAEFERVACLYPLENSL